MKNFSKYIIAFLLAFVMMANDAILDFQSNSATPYYESSFAIQDRELDLKKVRFYFFNTKKSVAKTSLSKVLKYLSFETIDSFQNIILQKIQKQLYQNLISFISQTVFVNEITISSNFKKKLGRL